MALPNKTFWVNYNARNYDTTNHKIPKESVQLFDQDLVLPGAVTFIDDHLTISDNKRIDITFGSIAQNIFNRTTNTASMTFIAKAKGTRNNWFVSNRNYGTVGWMVMHYPTSYYMAYTDSQYRYSSNTEPMIMVWRNGTNGQQYIAISDNVTGTPYQTTDWVGRETDTMHFFGGGDGSEYWTGDFYWLYISPETLTDAEIQQVIAYNDNLHTFESDKSSLRFAASGGTDTLEITAETGWTCTTPTAFTMSTTTGGTGTTTITVTASANTGSTKIEETITFTDADNYTFDVNLTQKVEGVGFSYLQIGADTIDTFYIGDLQIEALYMGEEQIYSNGPFVGLKVTKGLNFNPYKLTGTLKIKSSENWSLTDDSGGWLNYSQITGGTGETLVTVSASTTQSARTATITTSSANFTATTDVTQSIIVYKDLFVTGAANIVTDFNPYTFYTQNNNYMKIVLCHDYAQGNNGYLYKTLTNWFSFESTIWGSGFNMAGTTGLIGDNGLPNVRTTNTTGNPITVILDNGTANGLQGEYTQTNTFTGNMPNDNLVFYETSSSNNYKGHLYSFAVYGQNDVLAHWYVGYDDGVNVGIEDLVTGNKFQPNGSNYTIQLSDL